MSRLVLKPRHYLGLLLSVAVILAALWWTRPRGEAVLAPTPPMRVQTAHVTRRDLLPVERIIGRLQPARRATLRFEVAGRVVTRPVEPGQTVAAGDALLSLEAADYRDRLAQARAALSQEQAGAARDRRLLTLAERNAALAAREVERLQRLGKQSLASRSGLDAASQKALQLEAEVARLHYSVQTAPARLSDRQAVVDRAERDLARTTLRAPFAGLVNRVEVEVGDVVGANQTVLTLIDTGSLDAYLEVPGEVARALQLGQAVALRVGQAAGKSAGKSAEQPIHRSAYQGHIVALQTDPDPATRTHALRVRLDDPATGLLPGMLVTARLPLLPLAGAMVVPVSAVLHEGGHSYVFRVADGRVHRIEVELGRREDDVQVIEAGVSVGERVVTDGVGVLADGQPVEAL